MNFTHNSTGAPYFNDEMEAAVGAGFATTDAILMGRVLYDEWTAYWPEHADEPFGDVLNSIKKYVVSNSLQLVGDVAADDCCTSSTCSCRRPSGRTRRSFAQHPAHCGGAARHRDVARLFAPGEPRIPLELLSSETFQTGVLSLKYGPVED